MLSAWRYAVERRDVTRRHRLRAASQYRHMTKIGWQHDGAARRPPKHGKTMTGAERRLLYAKARRRDMTDVAYGPVRE
jgi:hypothetical protein